MLPALLDAVLCLTQARLSLPPPPPLPSPLGLLFALGALVCSLRASHIAQYNQVQADRTAAFILSMALLVSAVFAYTTGAKMRQTLAQLGDAAPQSAMPLLLQLMSGVLAVSHVVSWAELDLTLPFAHALLTRLLFRSAGVAGVLVSILYHPGPTSFFSFWPRLSLLAGSLFLAFEGWRLPQDMKQGLALVLRCFGALALAYLSFRWSWDLFWTAYGSFALYLCAQLPTSVLLGFVAWRFGKRALELFNDSVRGVFFCCVILPSHRCLNRRPQHVLLYFSPPSWLPDTFLPVAANPGAAADTSTLGTADAICHCNFDFR